MHGTKSLNVALVGAPNAGKSSILNALLGQKVSAVSRKYNTTRQRVLGVHTRGRSQIIFYDTPGIVAQNDTGRFFRPLVVSAAQAVPMADVVVLVIDVAKRWDAVARNTLREIIALAAHSGARLVVACNKADLLKKQPDLLRDKVDGIVRDWEQAAEDCGAPGPDDVADVASARLAELAGDGPPADWGEAAAAPRSSRSKPQAAAPGTNRLSHRFSSRGRRGGPPRGAWEATADEDRDVADADADWGSDVADTDTDWGRDVADAHADWGRDVADADGDWAADLADAGGDWATSVAGADEDWATNRTGISSRRSRDDVVGTSSRWDTDAGDRTKVAGQGRHANAAWPSNPYTGNTDARTEEEQLQVWAADVPSALLTSAVLPNGLQSLSDALFQMAVPRPWHFSAAVATDMTDKERVAEVIREQLFHTLNQEVPYLTRQENRAWSRQPNGALYIDQDILVPSSRHARMLTARGGAPLRKIAKAATQDLERMFKCRVRLGLHVGVRARVHDEQ